VKIHKVLGLRLRWPDGRRVAVDDPALDPLFDAAGRLGLPVAIHTGDPKAFFDPPGPGNERGDELQVHPGWSFADRSLYPTWPQIVDEFERRVARSSRTTFIGVHFGNAPEEPARVGRMLAAHANLWVDTAARIPELGRKPAEVRQVILDHQDRVLFGTDLQLGPDHLVLGAGEPGIPPRAMIDRFFDATWRFFETPDRQFDHPTPIQGRWRIDGLGLPEAVVEKVYRRNAERLLGEAAAAP
jgi:predicted TIM-barrel fold metal-dependent hydrolase